MSTLEHAFHRCETITRQEARNFYYGIRLLPADKRNALCAVYALARRIDDIGDGELPPERKLAELEQVREAVCELSAHDADPVYAAVADACRRLPIPLGAFGELVEGVSQDVRGTSYAHFGELVGYCRCVAGSVGRLCLGVFGSIPDPQAAHYADALGIALQQTNILRDIREDLMAGRVYLPTADLHRFGVELGLDDSGRMLDPEGALTALVRESAARAQSWYLRGLRLVPLLDRRSAACCSAMAGIYRSLLADIAQRPDIVFDRRASLGGWQKTAVATRALATSAFGPRTGVSAPAGVVA